MVVFYIFGIFLATASGFETLRLTPGQVSSNLHYETEKVFPVEVLNSQVHNNNDCPQNEILLKILNILNSAQSKSTLANLDGNTRAYVLGLIKNVLHNTSQHNDENISKNIIKLNNTANRNGLRNSVDDENKKVKITVQYELPAGHNCRETLEHLYNVINDLNEKRKAELINFEMRTENPEQELDSDQKLQDKLRNEESLNVLFNDKETNDIDVLHNYRPADLAPVENDNKFVSFQEKIYAPSQNPNVNEEQFKVINNIRPYNQIPEYIQNYNSLFSKQLVQPEHDHGRLQPINEKTLWKNPHVHFQMPANVNYFNRGQDNKHDYPSEELLKSLLAIAQQQPQIQSHIKEVKYVKDTLLPKSRIEIKNLTVIPSKSQKNQAYVESPYLNKINYIYTQAGAPAVPESFENHYESNVHTDRDEPHQASIFDSDKYSDHYAKQASNDHVVEITYVLQKPKTVHYEPVYLIKYRLPLKAFEEAVHRLLLKKPQLKNDPNQLYQELLAALKFDGRFTEVTELKNEEITKRNGNDTTDSNVLRSLQHEDIDKELDIIKALNSNMPSKDLIEINNGTVQDELRRMKRHHF